MLTYFIALELCPKLRIGIFGLYGAGRTLLNVIALVLEIVPVLMNWYRAIFIESFIYSSPMDTAIFFHPSTNIWQVWVFAEYMKNLNMIIKKTE